MLYVLCLFKAPPLPPQILQLLISRFHLTTMSVPPNFAGLKLSNTELAKTPHTLELCELS